MNIEIFAVYDSKSEAYLTPFFSTNRETAQRVFMNAANDKKHQFGANSADYALFHIGSFNEETANIIALKIPKSLGLAQEYVKKELKLEETDFHKTQAARKAGELKPQRG